jgi:hypothetical protein
MSKNRFQKLTGSLFIAGAILINIPYTLLIMNFEYPDILRESTGYILTQFYMGGNKLIFTWLAFAWVGLPLLFAIIMLQKVLKREDAPYLGSATVVGVVGAITQMLGLLRWSFVVPILAQIYVDPDSNNATKEAVLVSFQVIHQYGGVILGEHIGQTFSIIWMFLICLVMLKARLFKSWLGWFGIVAAVVYLLAQTELLNTVMPTFPVVPEAGLIGSLLWLGWMIALGIFLVRAKVVPEEKAV